MLYAISENTNKIVARLKTENLNKAKHSFVKYLNELNANKSGYKITNNPQKYYGLNPMLESSWSNVKKEIRNEAIVKRLTNMIYESLTEELDMTSSEIARSQEQQKNLINSFVNQIKRINPKISTVDLENMLLKKLTSLDLSDYDPAESGDYEELNPDVYADKMYANESVKKSLKKRLYESLCEYEIDPDVHKRIQQSQSDVADKLEMYISELLDMGFTEEDIMNKLQDIAADYDGIRHAEEDMGYSNI